MEDDLAPNQRMVPVCESVLAAAGRPLTKSDRVLDFGCGLGRHTREFRAAGYDVLGVDRPVPAEVESLAKLDDADGLFLSSPEGRFPFVDASFDVCFSTSVMEHVRDFDEALAEIARVLTPSGVTLHIFPARWRPIEPHIYVPFGGRFQSRWWFRLWARLGRRNEFQQGMDWRATSARNVEYARTGINYPTAREVRAAFGRHFADVRFVEPLFVEATRTSSSVSRLVAKVARVPGVSLVYQGFHTRVVVATAPRR